MYVFRYNVTTTIKRHHLQDVACESTPLLIPDPRMSPLQRQKKPSLLKVLGKTFWLELLHANIWKLVYDVTLFISPFLLK